MCLKIRNRKETGQNFQKAIKYYNHQILSELPRIKSDKVKLKCLQGHEFESLAEYIVRAFKNKVPSGGCKACRDSLHSKKAQDTFLKELEEAGYELLTPYEHARKKVKIRRKSDGAINYVSRNYWTEGRRWIKPPSKRLTKEDMQAFLNERRPGYIVLDCSKYKNKYDLITIQCAGLNDKKEKHTYETQWQIVQYYSCNQCSGAKQSKEEVLFRNSLKKEIDLELIPQWGGYPVVFQPKPRPNFDIFFPSHKLAIEYCGLWFHSTEFKKPTAHLKKLKLAQANGYKLFTVFEDEWKNSPEIVISRIKATLGLLPKIYARNCDVKQITKQQSRGFLNQNHLQGSTSEWAAFGLFFKEELVGVMTLGSFTRNKPGENILELKRLAFKKNLSVIGGSSKLLKLAEKWAKEKGYTKIISFADLRWSEGAVYRALGFTLVTKQIRPSKHYYKAHQRWNAQTLKLKPEEKNLGKTEAALRKEQGYRVIYDCGHLRWEKEI